MTTEKAKELQFDLLKVIRRYNEEGAPYDELAQCVMNVAAMTAVTAEMEPDDVKKTFDLLYELAREEAGAAPIKN